MLNVRKNLSIAYHRAHKAVSVDTILVFYERSGSNLANLLTKILPSTDRRKICLIYVEKVPPT